MIYTIIMASFVAVNLIHSGINWFLSWKYRRRETFAVLMSKDGNNSIVKINPHETTFNFLKKSYIIPSNGTKYFLTIGKKKYVRYIKNSPEPYEWWTDDKPEIPADVLHSILENEGLKILNKPPFTLDLMKILIIGGILIVVFMIFSANGAPTP